jgi:hypothetical protein
MSKPNRKLTYPIGSVWTLGKPAQSETGLGKIVTIVGSAEDFRRVVVADYEHSDKRADVRIKNLGNKLAEHAKDFDPRAYKTPTKAEEKCTKHTDSGGRICEHSFIGRLLDEISWQGPQVKGYRGGGLGLENVLTIEIFQALDFLPRTSFFGEVVSATHGSQRACALLKAEVESAEFFPLPGTNSNIWLETDNVPRVNVQPDLIVKTKSVYCIVEAKRLRQSSFQPLQLAREFLLAHNAKDRTPGQRPLLLLVLSKPPPVLIQGGGRQSLEDAIMIGLREVILQPDQVNEWHGKIEDTVSWITWKEIEQIVRRNLSAMERTDLSVRESIRRLVQSITDSIERHGLENQKR